MKRLTYAVALGLGLMMNACGSSNSNPAASTCTNQYGQTINGTQVGNQCIASAGACTPGCQGNPALSASYMTTSAGQCVPISMAAQYGCSQYGTTGYPGYPGSTGYPGYPGYSPYGSTYPVYYGGGYGGYSGGYHTCYQTAYGVVCQ